MNRFVAADSRMNIKILENLKKIIPNIILIPQNPSFDDAVSAHPDMNILQIKDKIFAFSSTNVLGGEIVNIKINKRGKLSYPDDVRLNAVCIGNDFICRKSSVDVEALNYAEKCGMRIIDVKQGYVKCNIVVVSENKKAVITEDEGIEKTLTLAGYDVLRLATHDIRLEPYDYGFIGGASGKFEDKLLFTGDIKKHSEYSIIKAFCDKYSVKLLSLTDEQLYDYGSLLVIETNR